ncbi:cytochrome P450 [Streptacidiphilus sp. N1-12]|uniref:Cytochrome P450 n=2 Tax=Streptacidiphilus alkalitolerans TaxID=3342712 RepID=A0ABV6V962_9ACTN
MSHPVKTELITRPGPDPHTEIAQLRQRCPVHPIDFPAGSQAYLVVDHETAVRAFNDPRLSKDINNAPDWFRDQAVDNSAVLSSNMMGADPPEHTRLRKLVGRAFLPRPMERLRPRIQQITDDLIDAFPASGELDLLTAFAFPLPLMVICEFLGIRYQDRALFQRWGNVLSQDPGRETEAETRARRLANDEVDDYLTEVLAERRAEPRDDFIGDLVKLADAEDGYTDAELVSTIIFLIIAGHKTTANLIGNGTEALLRHPDQLALLRAEPGLVDSAVEEFLRYEGSVDRATVRFAAQDLSLAGVDIPRGSFVHLSVQAAGHDPAMFTDPERLDITRSPNRHMAFGHGAHFCAGAPLARLEGQVAFATLLRRLPELSLAVPVEELEWVADSSISRGLLSLPVRMADKRPR